MSHLTGSGSAARLVFDFGTQPIEAFSLIEHKLDAVEAMFRENLESPVAIVEEIGSFVAESGGKRVRPTLHLLCADLCRYNGPHDVLLATVLEFIHCATLIHDDIIDEAKLRRGRPSVNSRWDNNITVLFGDYLFAKAMEMALQAKSLEVMQQLAEVTLRMTEGEMIQTRYAGRVDLDIDEYIDLVHKKTAALFGCCCELAGVLAGVDPNQREALRNYGVHLGFAFQLIDDMLDFTGDPAAMGKPAANDLREGKATLAVIDLLSQEANPQDRQAALRSAEARKLVQTIMRAERVDAPEIPRLTAMLQDSGALDRTRARARQYADAAVAALDAFPDCTPRQALMSFPDRLIHRDR